MIGAGGVTWQPLSWAVRLSVAILLVAAAAEVVIITEPMRAGHVRFAGDFVLYQDYTRQWLATGSWYLPAQLAGPYAVEPINANMYPPTLLYLTVPFALGLPAILWWAVPLGIIAAALRRPPWWAWPLLAFVVAWPRTWYVLTMGNPSMWAIAFVTAGARWGWPAAFAAVKLTFAPLVLAGIRHRSFWGGAVLALALGVPFALLWADYVTALRNASSNGGIEYLLGEWPIALILAFVVTWSRADDDREDVRQVA